MDEDGKPMVMYHGTRAENGEFYEFDYSKAKVKGGHGLKALGEGNYFTSRKLTGKERFGSRVIQAYLSMVRALRGARGLKFQAVKGVGLIAGSCPARGSWIEIVSFAMPLSSRLWYHGFALMDSPRRCPYWPSLSPG